MILQALALALTLQSNTTCQLQVEVRQQGRLVAQTQLEGFQSRPLVVQVQSIEPLEIAVVSRTCPQVRYRVTTTGLAQTSRLSVELAEKQFQATVIARR